MIREPRRPIKPELLIHNLPGVSVASALADPLLNLGGVALRLGISVERAERLRLAGRLPAVDEWVRIDGRPSPRWRASTIERLTGEAP